MDIEIKFNNWMRDQIGPMEIIMYGHHNICEFVYSNLIWNLAFALITNKLAS
jgi:hypothetical protein